MMTRMISLFFIRHGQGYHNIAYQLFGESSFGNEEHIDAKLTDHGIEQAKNLQKYFIDNKPDLIYSSSLSRCIQTMEHAIVNHTNEVIVDDRIMERRGDMCNKRSNKSELQKLTYKMLNLDMVSDSIPWTIPRESNERILERGIKWFDDLTLLLQQDKSINKVAVFTHCEFLEVMYTNYFDKEHNETYVGFDNCEVREVRVSIE